MSIRLSIDPELLGKEQGVPITAEVEGGTVGECLDNFMKGEPVIKTAVFDETGGLKVTTQVYVNSIPVFIRPLKRTVKDKDEIDLLFEEVRGR